MKAAILYPSLSQIRKIQNVFASDEPGGRVGQGITRSLIYVEVLRVIDVVQTSGVVYPASRRRLSHRSHNEQFSALITASRRSDQIKRNLYRKRLDPGSASLSQAARWDQRMTP